MAQEEKKKGGLKVDTKQLGMDGIAVLEVTGGLMLANVAHQLVPIENKFVKPLIPIGVGGLAIAFMPKNTHVKHVGIGMVAFGTISLLRAAILGANPSGTTGIGNIGANETVSKIANILLPNLGNANPTVVYRAHEARTEEIDFAEAEVVENAPLDLGSLDLSRLGGISFPVNAGGHINAFSL